MSHIFIEAIVDSGVEMDGDFDYVVDASAYVGGNYLFKLGDMAERYGPDDYEYPDFIWDVLDRVGIPQLPSLDYTECCEDKLREHLLMHGHTLTILIIEDEIAGLRAFDPRNPPRAVSGSDRFPPIRAEEEFSFVRELAESLRERDFPNIDDAELDF